MTDLAAIDRLEAMGFRKAADWLSIDERLDCVFGQYAEAQNILYAFVSDRQVLYVGKTIRTLKQRMYNYKRPGPSQSTSIKGNRRIRELLADGHAVEVFALPDNGLLYYAGFHVNLAAGLEDSLIAQLRPPWNGAEGAGQLRSQSINEHFRR